MALMRVDRALLVGACGCGLVHAGFSFYWGLGGGWLLDTVGQGAVDFVQSSPVAAAVMLTAVGLLKAAGAVVPLLAVAGRVPHPRLWRAAAAVGSVVLIVYGGMYTAVSWSVLAGWITVPGGYDRTAQLGHAALWDPLFLVWGVLLAGGLWLNHRNSRASTEMAA
jgi:hypothetical protein